MHVLGFSLEQHLLLQFLFTGLLIGLGLIYVVNRTVKNTASKYLVATKFGEETDFGVENREISDRMLAFSDGCFVCGSPTKKRCSRCKAVRYCSSTCQKQHWDADHKLKCKQSKACKDVESIPSASNGACGWRTSGWADNVTTSASLVPARGICKELRQPKKVLFPYDEFVKLFNWDKPGLQPCGLLNCGNSCFANVVLQCLTCTRPLIAYLMDKDHMKQCSRNDWCFLCELQVHVHKVRQSSNPFSPINILSRIPNIGGNLGYGKQEDAHEFMRFAIDTMQSVCLDEFGGEKALDLSTQETTLIQHIFGGHLQSQVICTKCNQISNRYENMMDLTVEIHGDAESLEECLNQFTVKEWLDGENMYKCDGCNDYVTAWKRLTVHQAPNVLTIALKRFQTGRFGKLNKRVTFPETLDLGPYMSQGGDGTDLYKLYAVVVHVDMLNASFFGHYICYTKDLCGNWYRIDDCKVMKVELEEVLSQRAYMLLYSRICVRQPHVKPLEPAKNDIEEPKLVELIQEPQECSVNSNVSLGLNLPLIPEHEGELVCDVNSETVMEDKEEASLAGTGSDPLGSKGLEECGRDTCSQKPATIFSSISNQVSSSDSLSCEPEPKDIDEPCTNLDLGSGFTEDNSTRTNGHESFFLQELSFDDSLSDKDTIIGKMGQSSSGHSIATLNLEPESLELKSILSASVLDPRPEKKVASSDLPVSENRRVGQSSSGISIAVLNPATESLEPKPVLLTSVLNPTPEKKVTCSDFPVSENGRIGSTLVFPANEFVKTEDSMSHEEKAVSGQQFTPLFSPGFLDRHAGKKSLKKRERSQNEFGNVGPHCNGFAYSGFAVENGRKT